MLYTFCNKMMYVWRQKSSHLPSVQRDGQYRAISIPFPFSFRAFAVLVHLPFLSIFRPFSFCSKGSRPF